MHLVSRGRDDIDDHAGSSRRDHPLGSLPGPEKGSLEIDVHDPIPLLFRELEQRRDRIDTRIVDSDPRVAKLFHHPVNQAAHAGGTGEIDLDSNTGMSVGGSESRCRCPCCGSVEVRDRHVRAGLCQSTRNGESNAHAQPRRARAMTSVPKYDAS